MFPEQVEETTGEKNSMEIKNCNAVMWIVVQFVKLVVNKVLSSINNCYAVMC